MSGDSMNAIIFKGVKDVAVEQRPIPKIQKPDDIIVKVEYTALCGSELHVYRGHQPSPVGFIMGHEFTGTVKEIGSDVKTLAVGESVVCPFTTNCGKCFYCERGFSSRCQEGLLFGTALLDGAQAQYVRVPQADSTVIKNPGGIDNSKLCLMADIFPTGYFAANNAMQHLKPEVARASVVVVIGCGPVGLCALLAAAEYEPEALLAVDRVPDRLQTAQDLGAEPWNDQTQRDELFRRVKTLTNGRGADIVIEVVGHSSALDTGFQLLRPWGVISSVGVHNGDIPWTGNQAYGKNLTIKMGRCPVRSIFPQAMNLLLKKQQLLNFMTETVMPLSEAVEGYKIFDEMKARKIIFNAQK